jgi:hypothetical protein
VEILFSPLNPTKGDLDCALLVRRILDAGYWILDAGK